MADEQLRTLLQCSAWRFRICDFSVSSVVPSELSSSAVDGLDGFKEVFHFIALRIFLDFLSLSDHPGIVHLPQPLLYKAPASEKGCFGGLSPKVRECFV
ncbi:unnamed protein product [Schistocephalus solidus]|uniref:Uncharacterized protein n=1 Tax=Schistocephalus solidus TaxID=70667 RepID=A0A183TIT6_SCHSO|nr:unnamed protein product [Schistocephalus solidus]